MKWLSCGMRKQFIKPFMEWLEENKIEYSKETLEIDDIVKVFYKPIGQSQKAKCEAHIKYLCDNNKI